MGNFDFVTLRKQLSNIFSRNLLLKFSELSFESPRNFLALKKASNKMYNKRTALQVRAGQQSITANIWPLTAHIYHKIIIVTGGFSKKSFYYYYFYCVKIILNDLELVFLELLNI